jgi:hypothetical protein
MRRAAELATVTLSWNDVMMAKETWSQARRERGKKEERNRGGRIGEYWEEKREIKKKKKRRQIAGRWKRQGWIFRNRMI